jgi:Putative lumazine-binding
MSMTPRQRWTAGPTVEATLEDRARIRAAVLDYFGAWFEGDGRAMRQVLHPALAKYSVGTDPGRSGNLTVISYDELVRATERGAGRPRAGAVEVSVLGISGTIACAEARSDAYVELVLLLRTADGWRIVSTAWRWADGAGPRAPG